MDSVQKEGLTTVTNYAGHGPAAVELFRGLWDT